MVGEFIEMSKKKIENYVLHSTSGMSGNRKLGFCMYPKSIREMDWMLYLTRIFCIFPQIFAIIDDFSKLRNALDALQFEK